MDTFNTLRAAASIIYPERLGEWLYDTWAAHNRDYFNGILKPCGLVFGITPHGSKLGLYDGWLNTITLHISLIVPAKEGSATPWGLTYLGENFCSDVLLHEMIHQVIEQESPGGNQVGYSSHNNENWIAEINRLAPMLGFNCRAALIKQKRVNGKVKWVTEPGYMERMEIATFPHSFRPADYYKETARKRISDYSAV